MIGMKAKRDAAAIGKMHADAMEYYKVGFSEQASPAVDKMEALAKRHGLRLTSATLVRLGDKIAMTWKAE
jgi:hypothetical protein